MDGRATRGTRKEWDQLSQTRQQEIKRGYLETVKCPECGGPLAIVNDRTYLLHSKRCMIPVRFARLVLGLDRVAS